MALTKVTYVDDETVIHAQNLNDIQDEIIANGQNIGKDESNTATVESSTTASKPYSVGEHLMLDGVYYIVTTAIASGGTIVTTGENANVEEATIGEEISQLNGAITELGNTKAPVITDTASGAIASFPDGADGMPVKDLTVGIEPVQDLHGYENPWPAGGGKNLTTASSTETKTTDGVTFTREGNHISATGTAGGANIDYVVYVVQITLQAGVTYCFSTSSSTSLKNIKFLNEYRNKDHFTVTPEIDTTLDRFVIRTEGGSGTSINMNFDWQLEIGSSPTTFAPYSNICPISGWTGCNVWGCGKNLIPDIKYQFNSQNVFLGTSSNSRNLHLVPGLYTMKIYGTATGILAFSSDVKTTPTQITGNQNVYKFTIPEESNYNFWLYNSGGISASDITQFQLELGSTATSYEPYSGTTIPISWQSEAGTVYGGTLDVTTGLLTVTHAYKEYTSGWETQNSRFVRDISGIARYDASSHIVVRSNMFKPAGVTFRGSCGDGEIIKVTGSNNQICCWSSAFSSASDFNAYIAEHPMTVVYELASQQTYQLSPTEVLTLLGQNNIWSDTGDSTVEYPADTKLYIQKINTPTDDDMIADANIASGKYFIINNNLYLSTTAILAGDPIKPGTNCTLTNLAAALNALNS